MLNSSSYHIVEQPTGHLLTTAPAASLFGPVFCVGFPLLMWMCAFFIAGSVRRNAEKAAIRYAQPVKNTSAEVRRSYKVLTLIGVGGAALFWAIGYTSGSIILDRAASTATVTARMTAFLPAQHRTIPLQVITSATLDQKPNSRRIRLEMSHGQDLTFPIWSDRAGQQEAVYAINHFLQAESQRHPR